MKNSTKCILTALSVIAVAVTGSIFTYIGQQWYGTLDKPSQWPPNYLFPIAWSVIYLLTFVTLCNVANKNEGQKAVFVTAAVNGVLNVVWCLTFFTLRQIFPALAVILVNLTASVLLVLQVRRNGKLWFYVMLIYPVWITLATALNGAIWILN